MSYLDYVFMLIGIFALCIIWLIFLHKPYRKAVDVRPEPVKIQRPGKERATEYDWSNGK